ncbi:MAG: chemotaxis protein CheC [Methanolinea sp.]|nr:chemotaxis protein CheC [Methanolinea sp.]
MKFSRMQLEAMKELTNIGAAHAATSLSQILGTAVHMTVPEIRILDVSRIGEVLGDEVATMVVFQLQGDLPHGGFLVLHFPNESAARTACIMCGTIAGDISLGEMEQSALLEAGNIMVSSFLSATSDLLGMMMLPSPPSVAVDIIHAVIQSLIAGMGVDVDDIIVFQIHLSSEEHQISGNIILLLEQTTMGRIASILERMVGPASG